VLPYIGISKSNVRHGGFGSTNKQINYSTLLQEQNRPLCTLKSNGKTFTGFLDSGADISIISSDQWPHTQPTKDADFSIQGVGTMTSSQLQQSAEKLKCKAPEGLQTILQPYIAPVPTNLWGQDLLQQWNAKIYIPTTYSQKSLQLMNRMG
jgi:hypothetical protein